MEQQRKSEAWPRSARLRRRREFLLVQGKGTKASGQLLTGLARRNPAGAQRLGITVSTKVGNAVVRARVKRWIREAFRKNRRAVPDGVDLVLIARPGAGEASYAAVLKDLERIGKALQAKMSGPSAVKGAGPKAQ